MSRQYLLSKVGIALMLATGAACGASAQVTTQIYGPANALFAPYLRQGENCYGNPTALIIQGATLHSPTLLNVLPFNWAGPPPLNCASSHVDQTVQFNTMATTSGVGMKALYSRDATSFLGDTVPPGNNSTAWPTVNFITSEVPLGSTDVLTYNSGGQELGVTFVQNPQSGQYPIPEPRYGALIQFPMVISSLAIVYDPTYKRVRNADGSVTAYHFHVKNRRTNNSGGLVLDAATYCGIFNGQITNWSQIPTSLNGGVSLKDPADPDTFSVPLTIVGRSDTAAATSTLSRHLAAICPGVISGNQYGDASTALPSSLSGAAWNKANPNFGAASGVTDSPGKFTRAQGVDGEVDYIQFDPNNLPALSAGSSVVQGRIGYDGNDQVLPYVLNTLNNSFGLNSASLLRAGNSKAVSPTRESVALAYGPAIPPPTGADRANPLLWVQAASKAAAVAIPSNLKAYPIVSTPAFIGGACYASPTVTAALTAFLDWWEVSNIVESPSAGIIQASGSAPMPANWRSAIEETFLKPTSVANKALNLYIAPAGTGPTSGPGSQCQAVTPGG